MNPNPMNTNPVNRMNAMHSTHRKTRPTRPQPAAASKVLDRITGDDPALRRLIEEETLGLCVAEQIYRVRTDAGLTQAQLARLVGTTQSSVARLEAADYDGHSLSMLRRIADALRLDLEVTFVSRRRRTPRRASGGRAGR